MLAKNTQVSPSRPTNSRHKKRLWKRHATNVLRYMTIPLVAAAALLTLRDVAMPKTSVRVTHFGVPMTIGIEMEDPVRSGVARYQVPAPLPCPITISYDPDVFEALRGRNTLAMILSHEIGHCLDYRSLGGSHGKMIPDAATLKNERNADVAAAETYADAYAAAYLKKCGNLLSPLGWPSSVTDGTCSLPDPKNITPNGQPGMEIQSGTEVYGGTDGKLLVSKNQY